MEQRAPKRLTVLLQPLGCITANVSMVIADQTVKSIQTNVTQIHAKMEELVLPSMIHTCALVRLVIAEQIVKLIQMNVIQIRAKTEEHALKHRTGLFKQLGCIIANVLLVIAALIAKSIRTNVTQIPV
jgi:hypothetical protein